MSRCNQCGEEIEGLPYNCNYCGMDHCTEHRQPEKHGCLGISKATPLGPEMRGESTNPGKQEFSKAKRTSGRSRWGMKSASRAPSGSFRGWIQRQSVVSLVVKTAIVATLVIFAFVGAGTVGGFVEPDPSVDHFDDLADEIGSTEAQTGDDLNRSLVDQYIHQFVNQERRDRDLQPLDYDEDLQEIARYHSSDMARNGYFAHKSPDGEDIEDRYQIFGYNCNIQIPGTNQYAQGAENIAQTYYNRRVRVKQSGETEVYENERELARSVVDQWMHSPGHRDNILKPYWNAEGIGVYIRGQKVYVTQNFC